MVPREVAAPATILFLYLSSERLTPLGAGVSAWKRWRAAAMLVETRRKKSRRRKPMSPLP